MVLPFGFIIRGATSESRRLVNADAAFRGYCSLDGWADAGREGYLSAFQFGDDFRALLETTGSCKGFEGACWSSWIWFDIDRDDLDAALADARRLVSFLRERYRLDDDDLLTFFSGSKGFHIGLPTGLWLPEPSTTFHKAARRFAERIGELIHVAIDTGVYDRVRAFRAPNSRHPKTALRKRRLTVDELLGLTLDGIRLLAREPQAFDIPTPPAENEQAKRDWLGAVAAVRQEGEVKAHRRESGNERLTVNRATFDFLRDGAGAGERHARLFSAAANLAEFGCPAPLAHALLTDVALDCGLSPSEARRQIDCGLSHVGPMPPAAVVASPPVASTPPSAALEVELAKLWATAEVSKPVLDDDRGDAWEPPSNHETANPVTLDFPFGETPTGPYSKEGDKR